MPYPTSGESQENYVHRFMGSGEAQSSFPKNSQRLAVAYSMYKQHHLAKAVRSAKSDKQAKGDSS